MKARRCIRTVVQGALLAVVVSLTVFAGAQQHAERPEVVDIGAILVSWRGAIGASAGTVRSRSEAQRLADQILRSLRRRPNEIEAIAAHAGEARYVGFVDCVTPPEPAERSLVRTACLLPVDGSALVETPEGFHVVLRNADH